MDKFKYLPKAAGLCMLVCATPLFAAEVESPAGSIIGTEVDGLSLFQGIPYAEAPVGDLRWAPPVARKPFNTPFQASDPGAECVQAAVFWRPGYPASWNEDCLSLSVYAPQSDPKNLPVIVGFHGGGSVNGSKVDWDPKGLARSGHVVVTVNYRLGALGFLALPELEAESSDGKSSGDYGDLDRAEALRWVQKNISAFGGDPKRVTIAGQSAGARGVCWLLGSPTAAGLFSAAIVQSGRDCPMTPKDEAIANSGKFVAALGCDKAENRLACLREATPAEIIAAQKTSGVGWPQTWGGSAMPVPVKEAIASGQFNKVPVIFGHTRNERAAATYEGNDLLLQPISRDSYESYVRKQYPDRADKLLAAYSASADIAPGKAKADIDTDSGACAIAPFIGDLGRHVPLYLYEFGDETAPDRPYMTIPKSFPIGTGHSAELPYVWETLISGQLSDDQRKTADVMTGYWTALGDGSPMTGWPAYAEGSAQRIRFLESGKTELQDDAAYAQAHNCALYQ
ncbi:carboxylesterase/lipase family protein [Paracoccus sp. PAR01]|uniref:carboxylesterase/lipase family protein n=1 Tax=Paracoccus sp. PAR01 TaxID=2769282 RepID=UPI00178700C4|nr:carboxylesterase family protein [Paracoccus sp. PAR01]MBD9528890.1 carboxylesterase family protein [Paracoccus sp. PAR01]